MIQETGISALTFGAANIVIANDDEIVQRAKHGFASGLGRGLSSNRQVKSQSVARSQHAFGEAKAISKDFPCVGNRHFWNVQRGARAEKTQQTTRTLRQEAQARAKLPARGQDQGDARGEAVA